MENRFDIARGENMGRKIAGVVLVLMMILANSAYAANWVFYNRAAKLHTEYIDSTTVYKDGNKLTFWVLQVLDRPLASNYAKQTLKFEVKLSSPREFRIVEFCIYDAKNRPGTPNTKGYEWELAEEYDNRQFDFALKYAKNKPDPGIRPTP